MDALKRCYRVCVVVLVPVCRQRHRHPPHGRCLIGEWGAGCALQPFTRPPTRLTLLPPTRPPTHPRRAPGRWCWTRAGPVACLLTTPLPTHPPLQGTRAVVLDTRKTVPGLRLLDKWAVRIGGGENHRMGLYDMLLIKDNHIAAAGGIEAAVAGGEVRVGGWV